MKAKRLPLNSSIVLRKKRNYLILFLTCISLFSENRTLIAQCESPGDVFSLTYTGPTTYYTGSNCTDTLNITPGTITISPTPSFLIFSSALTGYSLGSQVPAGTVVTLHYIVGGSGVLDTLCFDIAFVDGSPPIAICDANKTISLSSNGAVTLNAAEFDNGSYDNCEPVNFLIAKMDDSFSPNIFNRCYYPTRDFSCDDVGEQQVILLVLDGNPEPFSATLNSPSLGCDGTSGLFLSIGFSALNYSTCITTVNVQACNPTTNSSCPDPMQYPSASCNLDINIDPEGQNWQAEKRAVLLMANAQGTCVCSGALINNTSHDGKLYFLTARHCIDSDVKAQSARFLWNWEYGQSGQIENCVFTEGATLIASAMDFTLLELNTTINDLPSGANPFFAGWDYSGNIPSSTTVIHHPKGSPKKISIDDDPPGDVNASGFSGNSCISGFTPEPGQKMWKLKFDHGTVQEGSSGAPVFDSNKRIIGNLSSAIGYQYKPCGISINPRKTFAQKISDSWVSFPKDNKQLKAGLGPENMNDEQLKAWLDPENMNVLKLDGYDPSTPALSACLSYEPNNSFAQAEGVFPVMSEPFNGFLRSYICQPNDEDYFKIFLSGAGMLTLNLKDLPANYNLYLYDALGNQIGASQNIGNISEQIVFVQSPSLTDTCVTVKVKSADSSFDIETPYKLEVGWVNCTQEICDGKDNDCDGLIDENDPDLVGIPTWYADQDGDGYGVESWAMTACEQPAGFASEFGDCDDYDSSVNPGAVEICNGIDDNCNGEIDEAPECDADMDGYTIWDGDCDDNNPAVNPGAIEICNGIDDNCDGIIDGADVVLINSIDVTDETCAGMANGVITINATTGIGTLVYSITGGASFSTGSTFNDISPGSYDIKVYVQGHPECAAVGAATVNPGTTSPTWYKDLDGDGYSDGLTQISCSQPAGFDLAANLAATSGDCNDYDANQFPGQTWYKDADDDGYSDGTTIVQCAKPAGYKTSAQLISTDLDCDDSSAAVNPGASEICNGEDDDCDGDIDEGLSGMTHNGNVVFTTQAQVDAFWQCISVIDGSLIIQGPSITNLANLANLDSVTGNVTIQYTNLTSLDGLDGLTTIGATLMVKTNSQLEELEGLNNLTSVGNNLMIYFNFKLSVCCAIKDLLNTPGAVGGAKAIYYNKVGCNSAAQINSVCNPRPEAMIAVPGSDNAIPEVLQRKEKLRDVEIFPNPANQYVEVLISNEFNSGSIRLFDATGRLQINEKLDRSIFDYHISLEGIPPGIYLVRVVLDNEQFSERLVVE
jgi:Putative metal-binding motif/Secretion system C-terminal sorting domain/Trypsin-like peptidase domain/Receptor L domain